MLNALQDIRGSWHCNQVSDNWFLSKDGDPHGLDFFKEHYSRREYADGREPKLFMGPGYKMLLVKPASTFEVPPCEYSAMFAWRDCIQDDGQVGTCCSIFRNESLERSSDLILEAEEILQWAATEWWLPGVDRVFTYVDPGKVRSSNPGYCFKKAGWEQDGTTSKGLIILSKYLN